MHSNSCAEKEFVSHQIRNEEVIKSIASSVTLEAMVLKQRFTYFGHVMRNEDGIGRDVMLGKTYGAD